MKDKIFATHYKSIDEVIGIDTLVKTNKDGLLATFYEDSAIPVFDPRSSISIKVDDFTIESKIVVLKHNDEYFGFVVDSLMGVETISKEDIKKPSIIDRKYVRGKYGNIELVDFRDFIIEDLEEEFNSIRENEIEIRIENQEFFSTFKKEEEYIKKEINKDLINLIIDKQIELTDNQIDKIANIGNKLEGL